MILLSVINAILPGSTVSEALRLMKINIESLVIFQEKINQKRFLIEGY